ncbi:hypothetical protein AaE_016102 [Aphanomyces astaci]|uniref:Uncharacterized protein n=1 Tax=Aphanomyces astaci TaxID=112090 RepID=A0A6A4YUW3_APHAT|nr:hypothetical protein AaE_016102 [Aphanomyces astaci]
MQYYRQTKNWLLEKNPSLRVSLEERLQKMARTFERHCLKREHGGVVKKAEACTKQDLCVLVQSLHNNAQSSKDYQDDAMLVLLWHCFGRASYLSLVQRQQLAVSSGSIVTIGFVRMKTSEEQRLVLYPDQNPYTCPLLSIALALLTQATPSVAMLSNLLQVVTTEAITIGPGTPLLSLLDPLVALTSCLKTRHKRRMSRLIRVFMPT